ncbi:hypothetical protein BDV93DRAFT_530075, partial [Ceratobasidium sp. AG-I]
EGGDGHSGQGEGRGNGRGRRRGRKPAIRSQDATGTTSNRPGNRMEAYAHDATTPSTQIAPADAKGDRHKPMAIVAMAYDETEREEGNIRMSTTLTTPNVVRTSPDDPAIDLDAFDASTTPNSVQTGPDDASIHPNASDAFSSLRIANLRDQEPATLENARQNPFEGMERETRRKSTFREGIFDEGGTAHKGVETNDSQKLKDGEIVSTARNDGQAMKTNIPEACELPTRSSEALEPSEVFERPTGGPGPPIHLPEAAEPSQASQTTPTPSNQPPATGHTPESNNDVAPQSVPEWVHTTLYTTPSMRVHALPVFDDGGVMCSQHEVIEDLGAPEHEEVDNTVQNDRENTQTITPGRSDTPEPLSAVSTPSERSHMPPEVLEPKPSASTTNQTRTQGGRLADDAPAETAETHEAKQADRKEGHADSRIRVHTTPTLSDPAHANPIGTPGDRIAPSTHSKCVAAPSLVRSGIGGANGASERARHAITRADADIPVSCTQSLFVMGTFPSSYLCFSAYYMLSLRGCVVSQLSH